MLQSEHSVSTVLQDLFQLKPPKTPEPISFCREIMQPFTYNAVPRETLPLLLKTTLWPSLVMRRTLGPGTFPGPELPHLMGTLCSAPWPQSPGEAQLPKPGYLAILKWIIGNSSASASEHWVMHSIALTAVTLHPTQWMRYCYYSSGEMELWMMLACWEGPVLTVTPEQPDVTIYDWDWARCLFWE